MKLELSFYGALCETQGFFINGIEAYWDDFGEKYDRRPEDAEDYGCGLMKFTPTPLKKSQEILSKYEITKEEYTIITDQLAEGLSFGNCGWCI